MAWLIKLTPQAEKTLATLDLQVARRILDFLYGRVAKSDDPFRLGKILKGPEFENMLRFRVGDYRILTRFERGVMTVFVVEIGHRREVYR